MARGSSGFGSRCVTSRLVLVLLGVGSAFLVRHLDPATALSVSKAVLAVISVCGLVASVAYWLAFHPTPAYLRWVERRLGPAQG